MRFRPHFSVFSILPPFSRGGVLEGRDNFVDVRFRRIRPADENQIVLTFFHISSISCFRYSNYSQSSSPKAARGD